MRLNREKLLEAMANAEHKALRIRKLLKEYDTAKGIISDIEYLKMNAGTMLFVGRSGKIGEIQHLKEIRINDISGCVAVPELLLYLANKKVLETENKLQPYLQGEMS